MSALSLSRQQDRLRMVQDAAARALAAYANGSRLSRRQLFDTTTEHPEYFWAHAAAKAWETAGWIRPSGVGERGATTYEIVASDRFRELVDDVDAASAWVSPPKLERVADAIAPTFEVDVERDDEPEISDEDLLAPFSEARFEPKPASVEDAMVGAIERAVEHLVAVEAALERDRKERDAQTEIILALGEKVEHLATRDDVAESIATIGAELVGAVAKSSTKTEIESLALALSERVAEERAARAAIEARLEAFERTFLARLDTQAEKASKAEASLVARLEKLVEAKLPAIEDVSQKLAAAYEDAQVAGEKVFKLYSNLVNVTGLVGRELQLNSEITTQVARSLTEILGSAGGSEKVKKALARAAQTLGETIVLHEHSRVDHKEIRATTIEPTVTTPTRCSFRSTGDVGVAVGIATGLGLHEIGGGEAYVEKKESKP